jgi:hypothetical protein
MRIAHTVSPPTSLAKPISNNDGHKQNDDQVGEEHLMISGTPAALLELPLLFFGLGAQHGRVRGRERRGVANYRAVAQRLDADDVSAAARATNNSALAGRVN